jgi:hypothetical protein
MNLHKTAPDNGNSMCLLVVVACDGHLAVVKCISQADCEVLLVKTKVNCYLCLFQQQEEGALLLEHLLGTSGQCERLGSSPEGP